MDIRETNYTVYLFFNGMEAGMCIDFDHAIFDLKTMWNVSINEYNLPVTIVDDSSKWGGEIVVSENEYYVNSPTREEGFDLVKTVISSLNHKIWYRQGEVLSHRF